MDDSRKEVTLAQVAKAKRKGLNFILDNLEVHAEVTVRDKDGNIKGKFNMRNNNAT